MRQVTGWLDASQVYGSNEESSDKLRLWQSGRLRTMNSGGRDLLPVDDENRECPGYDKGLRCFVTGKSFTLRIRMTRMLVKWLYELLSALITFQQVTVDPTCWSHWRPSTPYSSATTIIWPRGFLTSIPSGTTRGCSRKLVASSSHKCNTSPTMNTCLSSWVSVFLCRLFPLSTWQIQSTEKRMFLCFCYNLHEIPAWCVEWWMTLRDFEWLWMTLSSILFPI